MFKKHFKYFILAISSVLFITILGIGLGLTAYGLGMESKRFAYSVKDHINKIIPKGKYTTKPAMKLAVGSKVGFNPKTNELYDDPNDVAIEMWTDESLSSLQYSPKPFIESGFAWIAQGGLKDLLAVNYKKTDFYSGKGAWDLTKPETAKWVSHDNIFPYAEKTLTTSATKKKPYTCAGLKLDNKPLSDLDGNPFLDVDGNPTYPQTCREKDGKIQILEVANYKGITDWDKTKAQSKADTFNKNFQELARVLGKKDNTGAIQDLDLHIADDGVVSGEDKILLSTKPTDFYKLDYAGALYRTRVGAIFLVILTPILGALLIGANVFVFIKYRGGLQ